MISVFFGFIVQDEDPVTMMGFGPASAVLFDAFMVRTAIVPAAQSLLGNAAWWLPTRLDRPLPNVDAEGEKLQRQPKATAPPAQQSRPQYTEDLVH